MSEYGLRAVHMGCLLHIERSENGMTVTELAKASGNDKALISRIVKELVSDGFLSTQTNAEDKSYRKKYCLTDKSRIITSDLDKDISEYMSQARGNIPQEDMSTFYEVLRTLTHNISLIASDEQ